MVAARCPSLAYAFKQGASVDAAGARPDPPAGLRPRDGEGLRSHGRGGGEGVAGRVWESRRQRSVLLRSRPNQQVDVSVEYCFCQRVVRHAVNGLWLRELSAISREGLRSLLRSIRRGTERDMAGLEMLEQRAG